MALQGIGQRFAANTDKLRRTTTLPSHLTMTLMFWVQIVTDRNTYTPFFYRTANASIDFIFLGTSSDGTTLFLDMDDTGSGPSASGTNLTVGTWYHVCYTANGAAQTVYLNAVSDLSFSHTKSTPGSDEFTIGHTDDTDNDFLNGRMAHVRIWDGVALTAPQIAVEMRSTRPVLQKGLYFWNPLDGRHAVGKDLSGHGNDFTLSGTGVVEKTLPIPTTRSYRSPGKVARIWIQGGGANAYTLTAAQGSFTETGQAVSLLRGRLIAPAQGAFTESGQTVGLLWKHLLTAVQGSYVESGQAVGLKRGYPLVAAQGAFTESGQTVALRWQRTAFALAQGSFTLAGQAANLLQGYVIHVNEPFFDDTYGITWEPVSVTWQRHGLVIAQGSFVETGQAVGLVRSFPLVAGQGSFTLTGEPVTFPRTRRLLVVQGAYVLTGEAVGLQAITGSRLVVGQGSFALTGKPVTLLWKHKLTAAQGVFVLTGNAVSYAVTPYLTYVPQRTNVRATVTQGRH